MCKQTVAIVAGCVLACANSVLAQNTLQPAEAVTAPRADSPITAVSPKRDASAVELTVQLLTGSFRSQEQGETPALLLHACPIPIQGLPGTLLVEVARADSPADPFRLYVLQAYQRAGGPGLRALELRGPTSLGDALAGLWAAPDVVPTLDQNALIPSADMPLSLPALRSNPPSLSASTEHPFPTLRGGAVEMTASIDLQAAGRLLRIAEAGLDGDGHRVWGTSNDNPIKFARLPESVQPLVRREDNGLVIITTIPPPPDALKLQPGGEIVIHYSSWTSTGQFVESSRMPGKAPATTRIPGSVIQGMNIGLAGIAKGERRRIVVPPALGYGERPKGIVPPNSTLIFDVECLRVDNSPLTLPQAPPIPPPAANAPNPHAPKSNPDQPIGSPPTNGAPETPRK